MQPIQVPMHERYNPITGAAIQMIGSRASTG